MSGLIVRLVTMIVPVLTSRFVSIPTIRSHMRNRMAPPLPRLKYYPSIIVDRLNIILRIHRDIPINQHRHFVQLKDLLNKFCSAKMSVAPIASIKIYMYVL